MQCLFWLSFSPVSANAKAYFQVDDNTIAWFLNIGVVGGLLCQPAARQPAFALRGPTSSYLGLPPPTLDLPSYLPQWYCTCQYSEHGLRACAARADVGVYPAVRVQNK